jgi:hypothetical protein
MRKIAVLLIFVHISWILTSGLALAQSGAEDAGKKAEEIHQRALSDVIFVDEELKALYYQNVQIISILKEIRELLRQRLEEEEE